MNNWGAEDLKKKNNNILTKVIIAMMILLLIIIITIVGLLYSIKSNTFIIAIDNKAISDTEGLLLTIDGNTYFNIEKVAKLLGYDYHSGEYKGYSHSENDKCYVQSNIETASFYLNSNKVCKLKVGAITEDYEVFYSKKVIMQHNNIFYAPLDAIQIAFNVIITEKQNGVYITTLQTLVANVDNYINGSSADSAIYNSLLNEKFDNQKAILYDRVIVSKINSGLYGIITTSKKEILADKYKNITFLETTKEFLVTNSLGKMGIVDQDGKNKVEQSYDSIKVINSNPKLYLVQVGNKYGVINENGGTIVYPEYDSIGIDTTKYKDIQTQYVLLDKIIPVCKDKKYGLFNIEGKKVLNIQYDGIGCELQSVNVDGVSKAIYPTAVVEECEGIVIKNGTSYDLFFVKDSKYQKISEAIYYLTESGEKTYYMLLNGREYELIDELIKANLMSDKSEETSNNNTIENNTSNEIQNSMNNIS